MKNWFRAALVLCVLALAGCATPQRQMGALERLQYASSAAIPVTFPKTSRAYVTFRFVSGLPSLVAIDSVSTSP